MIMKCISKLYTCIVTASNSVATSMRRSGTVDVWSRSGPIYIKRIKTYKTAEPPGGMFSNYGVYVYGFLGRFHLRTKIRQTIEGGTIRINPSNTRQDAFASENGGEHVKSEANTI